MSILLISKPSDRGAKKVGYDVEVAVLERGIG
jgi:hypothetical protein